MLQQRLHESWPFAHLVGSLRIKWDETQQPILVPVDDADDALATVQVVSVMVITAWFKLDSITHAEPWTCPLLQLNGLTADCMWSGLARVLPMGPFCADKPFPAISIVKWMWLILCVDGAAANTRLAAHAMVVVVHCKCVVHLLQAAARPLLKTGDLANKMFRAAHVLCVSTYWTKLHCQVVEALRKMVIVHNADIHRSDDDAVVAEELLRLTFPGCCFP